MNALTTDRVRAAKRKRNSITLTERMISAGTGALITALLMTPMDVTRTQLQAQQSASWHTVNGLNQSAKEVKFNGSWDTFLKITKHQGVRALYSGLSPMLIMAVPATVVYYSAYDTFRDSLLRKNANRPWIKNLSPLICGIPARTIAVMMVAPLELIRTQQQARVIGPGIVSGLKTNIASSGTSSLFKGLVPTLFRDVPFSGIYWMLYEHMASHLRSNIVDPNSNPFWPSFMAGAISGGISAILTQPFDVVKTRMQMHIYSLEIGKNASREALAEAEMGMWSLMWHIRRTEGMAGMFTGMGARLVKVPPACAVMISCYELGKWFFKRERVRNSETPD